jgi:crossover junction endodeoxyribonuclease RusA
MNHYYATLSIKGRCRKVLSKKGREYRNTVCAIMCQERFVRIEGPVTINIYAVPPDNRKRDCDNLIKPILDSLQHGGAYKDDSQINYLAIIKAKPSQKHKKGYVTVMVFKGREMA